MRLLARRWRAPARTNRSATVAQARGRYSCRSCYAAIPFAVHFRPSRKELRNPRHWIAPARGFYLLTRRFYCCCVFGMAQCLDDPLRDPPHIVLAHSARGASWRTKAQSTWAQGRARVVRDDLLVRRNANAVERFFRHLPVYIKTRHRLDHDHMIARAAGH